MANFIVLLLALAVITLLAQVWFPWAFKAYVLCKLNELRDETFQMGQAHPRVRRTMLYRDIDFMLALAVAVVRDEAYRESVILSAVMSGAVRGPVTPEVTWRAKQYDREHAVYFDTPEGEAQGKALARISEKFTTALAVRAATGSAASFFAMFLLGIPLTLYRLARKLLQGTVYATPPALAEAYATYARGPRLQQPEAYMAARVFGRMTAA